MEDKIIKKFYIWVGSLAPLLISGYLIIKDFFEIEITILFYLLFAVLFYIHARYALSIIREYWKTRKTNKEVFNIFKKIIVIFMCLEILILVVIALSELLLSVGMSR